MTADTSEAFADLMAGVDPAMTVVTTASGGERAGCLVGFQSQCSIEPDRYAVWLSKANFTFRVGLRASHFAVHHLTEDDRDLAELFGSVSGDDVDKFSRCSWTEGPAAVPVLDRLGNRFVGRRIAMLDEGGDHVCVTLGLLDAVSTGPFVPLRLSQCTGIDPGHGSQERPTPPTERST